MGLDTFFDYSYTLQFNKCLVCERHTQLSLCRFHFDEYGPRLKEPWLMFLKANQQTQNRRNKRDRFRVVSLDRIMGALQSHGSL